VSRGYKKKGNSNAGRPKKEIDQVRFEDMCIAGCTEDYICRRMGVSVETLRNWFKATYGVQTYKEVRKTADTEDWLCCDLRVSQINLSRRSPDMAKWLGKQYLGQTDNPVNVQATVQVEDDAISLALKEKAKELETLAAEDLDLDADDEDDEYE
jgi:hypothetical protein